MALSLGGSKNKSKSKSTSNETQTNTLSDRAAGLLTSQMNDVRGMSYQGLDPNAYKAFANPYEDDVIAASLAQANQSDLEAQNAFKADVAKAGAFGDKRRGIYEAELMGGQARDRASLISGMRDQNFNRATGIAQGENANQNQFTVAMQELLARLAGGFGNEGTTTRVGSGTGSQSGYQFGGNFLKGE